MMLSSLYTNIPVQSSITFRNRSPLSQANKIIWLSMLMGGGPGWQGSLSSQITQLFSKTVEGSQQLSRVIAHVSKVHGKVKIRISDLLVSHKYYARNSPHVYKLVAFMGTCEKVDTGHFAVIHGGGGAGGMGCTFYFISQTPLFSCKPEFIVLSDHARIP